jgi:hypothetical protein
MLGLKRATLPVILLTVLAADLSAQSFYSMRRERRIMAVGGLGAATYMGELSNPGINLDAKPNINVGLQVYATKRISLRAEATWFHLEGSDAEADDNSRRKRNLSFYSNNYELTLTGAFNLYPNGRRYYQRPSFNVYGFGGAGFFYMNPKTEYNGEKYSLQPLKTEGVDYAKFQPVLVGGLGARFRMGPFFNLAIEGGLRKTFTDYLDDVSTVHLGPGAFADPIAQALSDRRPEVGVAAVPAGTQRGNPDADDSYFLLNAKIEYYLPYNFMQGSSTRKLLNKRRKQVYNYRRRPRR